jgi:hypothetical protein
MDRVFLSRPGALQKGIYTASQTTIYFNSKGFREVDTKIYTAICFSQDYCTLGPSKTMLSMKAPTIHVTR